MPTPRKVHKIRKHVEFIREDFEWYIKTHNGESDTYNTGFAHLLRSLLSAYREICENKDVRILPRIDERSLTLEAARDVKEDKENQEAG